MTISAYSSRPRSKRPDDAPYGISRELHSLTTALSAFSSLGSTAHFSASSARLVQFSSTAGVHHYDLHVWLYKKNPSGVFYHANPDVDCTKGATYPLREEPPRTVPDN